MFERFTDRARRVVVLAQEEARLLNHNYIGTEHILLGLIHEGEGVAAKALESLGISLEAVRAQVEEIIGHGGSAPSGHIPFTPRAKKVLELSLREALQLGHNYSGTEHTLLGLIREGEGVAAQVLVKLGADLSRVRQQVIQLLSGYAGKEGAPAGPAGEGAQPQGSLVLDQFGRNLTQLAREGKLDPVIGREKEIERVMQVLSRRTKNNPVLIGEPGVGKTAIVEGHGVVLGPPREDLHDPLDFLLAPDHRVELALAGELGQVAAELVQHQRALWLRSLAGGTGGSALLARVPGQKLDDLLADTGEVGPQLHEDRGGDALALADEAEQDVLRADVVVTELQRLAQRQLEHLLRSRRKWDVT